jgi:tetratricopeptide (TPR) repeat protein
MAKHSNTPLSKIGITICLLFLAAVTLTARETTPDYRRWHDRLRDHIYNQDVSINQIEVIFLQAKEAVRQSSLGGRKKAYWLSRIEYLMGRAEQNIERKKDAAGYYEQALAHIEEALDKEPFSEGFRMKSEIISQMCLVKGVGFILSKGPKVNPLAEKALDLNPENGKAIILIASSKVYPPPIYGGNPEKGIELMQKANRMPDIEKDDRFNIYSGIGVAYEKLGEKEKAAYWLEKALELYPENVYAREQYEKVR